MFGWYRKEQIRGIGWKTIFFCGFWLAGSATSKNHWKLLRNSKNSKIARDCAENWFSCAENWFSCATLREIARGFRVDFLVSGGLGGILAENHCFPTNSNGCLRVPLKRVFWSSLVFGNGSNSCMYKQSSHHVVQATQSQVRARSCLYSRHQLQQLSC